MKYTLLIFFFLPTLLFGQSEMLSVSVNGAFPNGVLKSSAGMGIGGSVRYEHYIINHVTVIGSVGYLSFAEKTIQSSQPAFTIKNKISMIPIQIGAKFFLFAANKIQQGLFISGEFGIHVLSGNSSVNGSHVDIPSEADFSFGPGLGYRLFNVEISYRQQFIQDSGKSINFSNFGIAYIFKLKE